MKYKVFLLPEAEKDLLEIYQYVAVNDSVEKILGKSGLYSSKFERRIECVFNVIVVVFLFS